MTRLRSVESVSDIPKIYRGTPIGKFLEYHNLGRTSQAFKKPELLVSMCMDSRKSLRIPNNFAFVLRSGGANLRYSEFKVAYVVAVGGIRHLAIVGHTQCGMVRLVERKNIFVRGMMTRAGWHRKAAEKFFAEESRMHEIGNPKTFAFKEAERVSKKYPKLTVVPMIYRVEDNRLYLVERKGASNPRTDRRLGGVENH